MIKKLINLTAILMLMHLYVHINEYNILVNETNMISRKVVKIIIGIPKPSLMILMLIIILIIGLIKKGRMEIITTLIATLLLEIGVLLLLSELSMEKLTNCHLLIIEHTVPIEIKVKYLKEEIKRNYEENPWILQYPKEMLISMAEYIESNVDYKYLTTLNVGEINNYAIELIKKSIENYYINKHVGISTMFAILFTIFFMMQDIDLIILLNKLLEHANTFNPY